MQDTIKRVHIISRFNAGWAVVKQGASRALRVYPTKEDAVLGSYPFLQLGYDLVIHRVDGSVEQYKKASTTLTGLSPNGLAKKARVRPASPSRLNGTANGALSKKK